MSLSVENSEKFLVHLEKETCETSFFHNSLALGAEVYVYKWLKAGKRRCAVALRWFASLGQEKDWSNTHRSTSEKETRYWKKVSMETDRNQSDGLGKLWVLGSTKYDCQMDHFAFSNHQECNQKGTIRYCSF